MKFKTRGLFVIILAVVLMGAWMFVFNNYISPGLQAELAVKQMSNNGDIFAASNVRNLYNKVMLIGRLLLGAGVFLQGFDTTRYFLNRRKV